MKTLGKLMVLSLLLAVLATACGPKVEETVVEDVSWLEENQLGEFFSLDQDWAAIEAAAREEGKVVVYASSSRIEDHDICAGNCRIYNLATIAHCRYNDFAAESIIVPDSHDLLDKTLASSPLASFQPIKGETK